MFVKYTFSWNDCSLQSNRQLKRIEKIKDICILRCSRPANSWCCSFCHQPLCSGVVLLLQENSVMPKDSSFSDLVVKAETEKNYINIYWSMYLFGIVDRKRPYHHLSGGWLSFQLHYIARGFSSQRLKSNETLEIRLMHRCTAREGCLPPIQEQNVSRWYSAVKWTFRDERESMSVNAGPFWCLPKENGPCLEVLRTHYLTFSAVWSPWRPSFVSSKKNINMEIFYRVPTSGISYCKRAIFSDVYLDVDGVKVRLYINRYWASSYMISKTLKLCYHLSDHDVHRVRHVFLCRFIS